MNSVNRVQTDFNAIASSISNISSLHVIRHTDVIDLSVMYMERYYETVTERNHHHDDNANEDEGE